MIRRYNRMLAEHFGSEVDEELLFRDYRKPDEVEIEDDEGVDENEEGVSEEGVSEEGVSEEGVSEENEEAASEEDAGRERELGEYSRMGIQMESLFKLGDAEYDLLLVDESETILGQFTSPTMQSRLQSCFETFRKLLIKTPSGLDSSSEGLPDSAAMPRSMTMTMSASMMVCSRCAMAISVHDSNSSRIVFWMSASVSTSTLAVASSSTRTCGEQHLKLTVLNSSIMSTMTQTLGPQPLLADIHCRAVHIV